MKSNKKTIVVSSVIILVLIGLIVLFSMLLKNRPQAEDPTPSSTPTQEPINSPTNEPTEAPTETPTPTATPVPTKAPSGKVELDESIPAEWEALPMDGLKVVGQHDNSWYDGDYAYRTFTGLDLAVLLKERTCFDTKYALLVTCPRICDGSVAIKTDKNYSGEYDTVYGFQHLQMLGSDGEWHKMYAINYGWLFDRADTMLVGYTSEKDWTEEFTSNPANYEQEIHPKHYAFSAYDKNTFLSFGDPLRPKYDSDHPTYTVILPYTLRHGYIENRLLWAFRPTDEFIAEPIYDYYGELTGFLFRPSDPTLYREVDAIVNAQTTYNDLIKNSPYQKMVDEGYDE